jgi:uncharacterized membrane protein YciS (DUF1049 family)
MTFLVENSIFVVLIITMIIYIGVILMLVKMDKNIKSLENQISTKINES